MLPLVSSSGIGIGGPLPGGGALLLLSIVLFGREADEAPGLFSGVDGGDLALDLDLDLFELALDDETSDS